MTLSSERVKEYRALRNSARALFRREFGQVRREVTPKALGERLANRMGRKLDTVSDDTVGFIRRNGGRVAAIGGAVAGAIALWAARKPIANRLWPKEPDKQDNPDGGTTKETDDD